ncbi:unnamed protein product [Closterium sp. NIES-53]
MYLMTCTRLDLPYPLSLLARYVAPGRHRKGYTFSLGSGLVSWRSTRSSSVLSSSCEAEIYAGAMAAQELRWLTYLLTDLGEQPRSPPVLYVDNKAMIASARGLAAVFWAQRRVLVLDLEEEEEEEEDEEEGEENEEDGGEDNEEGEEGKGLKREDETGFC